jgi:hypothetical protein
VRLFAGRRQLAKLQLSVEDLCDEVEFLRRQVGKSTEALQDEAEMLAYPALRMARDFEARFTPVRRRR